MFFNYFKKISIICFVSTFLTLPTLAMMSPLDEEEQSIHTTPSKFKEIRTWIWNHGGVGLDYVILAGSVVGGQYVGSFYDAGLSSWVAQKLKAEPMKISYKYPQLYDLTYADLGTRQSVIKQGINLYGFPYDYLVSDTGAILGFFVGKTLIQLRRSGTNRFINAYPKIKSFLGRVLYSGGEKIMNAGKDLKEE